MRVEWEVGNVQEKCGDAVDVPAHWSSYAALCPNRRRQGADHAADSGGQAYHDQLPPGPLPSTLNPSQFQDNRAAFVTYTLAARIPKSYTKNRVSALVMKKKDIKASWTASLGPTGCHATCASRSDLLLRTTAGGQEHSSHTDGPDEA